METSASPGVLLTHKTPLPCGTRYARQLSTTLSDTLGEVLLADNFTDGSVDPEVANILIKHTQIALEFKSNVSILFIIIYLSTELT